MYNLLLLITFISILNAASSQEIRQLALFKGLQPIPQDYHKLIKMVDDSNNPMSIQKIFLGKKLFFDKNLSISRKIACAKCHDINKGGEDGLPTAVGHNKLKNPKHLNTPTVLNTAFSKHLFWDGRAKSLREQAKGPMQAPFEMNATPELIVNRVKENLEYKQLFAEVFEGNNTITFNNITKAIAVYEKTLTTRSAYDKFLEGDDSAISKQAQEGLELFINLGCKACHFGPAIGGQKIQKFPLRNYNSIINLTSYYDDKEKKQHFKDISLNFKKRHPYPFKNIGGFLGKDDSKYFRVPILRNISQTAPYFHNGAIKELKKAIFIMGKYQIGVELSKEQIEKIEAFLKSLEGKLVDYSLNNKE
ncbi:MAG: cytochrome c peroxidase [Sulfurimonas sp.]